MINKTLHRKLIEEHEFHKDDEGDPNALENIVGACSFCDTRHFARVTYLVIHKPRTKTGRIWQTEYLIMAIRHTDIP